MFTKRVTRRAWTAQVRGHGGSVFADMAIHGDVIHVLK